MRRQSWHFFRLGCNGVATALDSRGLSIVRVCGVGMRRQRAVSGGARDFDGIDCDVVPSLGVKTASSLSTERRCSANVKSEVVKGKESTNLSARSMGTMAREEMEGDGEALLVRNLERLKNYEKEGVPRGAGTDSPDGFDLERMKRLLSRLGNPLSAYPVASLLLSTLIALLFCFRPYALVHLCILMFI